MHFNYARLNICAERPRYCGPFGLQHLTSINKANHKLIETRKAATMSYENSVYLAKLAEQAERYEGM